MPRTKLFRHIDLSLDENKQLSVDLRRMMELREEHQKLVISKIPDSFITKSPKALDELLNSLEQETGASRITIKSAVDICRFLSVRTSDPEFSGDNPADFARDVCETGLLDGKYEDNANRFFEDLFRVGPAIRSVFDRESTKDGVFPTISSIGHTVELRAVIADRFKYGTIASDYEPAITGLVCVASISLGATGEGGEKFYVQVDEDTLSHLIEYLVAVRMEMKELKKRSGTTFDHTSDMLHG